MDTYIWLRICLHTLTVSSYTSPCHNQGRSLGIRVFGASEDREKGEMVE